MAYKFSTRNGLSKLVLILLTVCSSIGCDLKGDPQYHARKKLAEIGILFTKQSFAQRIYEGDVLAVELFLDAGMSPNAEADAGGWILSSDPEFAKWKGGLSQNDEAWESLILGTPGGSLSAVNSGSYRPLYVPSYLIARVKAAGSGQEYSQIVEIMLNAGASNEMASLREERIKNELTAVSSRDTKASPHVSDEFMEQVTKEVEKRVGSGK